MRGVAAVLLAMMVAPVAVAQQAPAGGTRVDVVSESAAPPSRARPAQVADIEVAYRAFAAGELDAAERMFTELIERQPSPAAYLLRGCTRYTRAMLSRNPGALSEGAKADIRRAFALNPSLSLDRRQFSPRLIAFLDEVRQ